MLSLRARPPAPVRNRVCRGPLLLALLGMFVVSCPDTRAYDITFVARPHQTEVDMSFSTKAAPAVYTFYGTPQSGWVFYGSQTAILGMSAQSVIVANTPSQFQGSYTIASEVTDVFELELGGNLAPTGTAAGTLVTAPWRVFPWDHTIKITTDPVYVSVKGSELTREDAVFSASLVSLRPDLRTGTPTWSTTASGLVFNPTSSGATTVTNNSIATGQSVDVVVQAEKLSPFSGTLSDTSQVKIVDVNIASPTVSEANEESTGVLATIASNGGVPLNLSITPAGLTTVGNFTLEASSSCDYTIYSDATLSTPLISGTQTSATCTIPSTVYLRATAESTNTTTSANFLSFSFTPSAQTGGNNPPVFKDKMKITVAKVKINPISIIAMDGVDTGTFTAVVNPSGLSNLTYEWTWYAPAGAGNSPAVTFSASSAAATTVKRAHWYASPDDPCTADIMSSYVLTCTVKHNGEPICSNSVDFTVTLIDPGGETIYPSIAGFPSMAYDSQREVYYVSGVGSLTRTLADYYVTLPASSYFWRKCDIHENKHKQDLDNGFDGHNFITVDELFSRIQGITDSTIDGLAQKLINAAGAYTQEETTEIEDARNCLEARAYQISDPEPPQFFYQNCNNTTCQ